MSNYKIMLYCPSYIRLNKIQFTTPPYVEELNKFQKNYELYDLGDKNILNAGPKIPK